MDQDLDAAERAHQAILCAIASLEAVKCRLLYDVRMLARLAPIMPLRERVERLCIGKGSLSAAVAELRDVTDSDPADSLS